MAEIRQFSFWWKYLILIGRLCNGICLKSGLNKLGFSPSHKVAISNLKSSSESSKNFHWYIVGICRPYISRVFIYLNEEVYFKLEIYENTTFLYDHFFKALYHISSNFQPIETQYTPTQRKFYEDSSERGSFFAKAPELEL